MTGKEVVNLIRKLKEKGMSSDEILSIIEYIETHDPTEKEINITLFDQLTLIERIERELERDGIESAKKESETIKHEINRKLYQKLPLRGSN